jgi:MFS family permease
MPPHIQGMATGIATAGSTFGQFVVIPVFALIVEEYGWRSGHVASGVVMLCMVPLALYLLAPHRVPSHVEDAAKSEAAVHDTPAQELPRQYLSEPSPSPELSVCAKLRALYSSRMYVLLTVSFFCCGVTTTGFLESHLVTLAVEEGFSMNQGAIAFGVVSASNGCGMVSGRQTIRRVLSDVVYMYYQTWCICTVRRGVCTI